MNTPTVGQTALTALSMGVFTNHAAPSYSHPCDIGGRSSSPGRLYGSSKKVQPDGNPLDRPSPSNPRTNGDAR